ncbi:MAG: hypothetical protein ABII00_08420 [Elusimicrobiota bacterium]
MTRQRRIFLISLALLVVFGAVYFSQPIKRVALYSSLVMLGDFDSDNRWSDHDAELLRRFQAAPFFNDPKFALKADINRNGFIDDEDFELLFHLFRHPDPYEAHEKAKSAGKDFPLPREWFRYVPETEYLQPPVLCFEHKAMKNSPLKFLGVIKGCGKKGYAGRLEAEIYSEGLRFSLAYAKRKSDLTPLERDYAVGKIEHVRDLFKRREFQNTFLNVVGLVEDAETLSVKGQSDFILRILYFRDSMRKLLGSPMYSDFRKGGVSAEDILLEIARAHKTHLGKDLDILNLDSPRDFKKIENYVERVQWQYYKSSSTRKKIGDLIRYAQYDRRYLRAVSRTTPRFQDSELRNHNLPMILLFREALRISDGDKKVAVGLLDEAIRIPFAWVKTIPKELLPSSIALENFLLPGNKEDGSDKSRHWNVFGGISLYKSPDESLGLALRRELADARDDGFSEHAVTEFIRDTIANINGIYNVVSMDPELLRESNIGKASGVELVE